MIGTNDHTLDLGQVIRTTTLAVSITTWARTICRGSRRRLQYIVGLISNYRVGALPSSVNGSATIPSGTQGPASGDTPGGSIVMLDYQAPGAGPVAGIASGYIHVDQSGTNYSLRAYSDFGAYLLTSGADKNKYDVQSAVIAAAAGTLGNTVNNTVSLQTPRFLKTYVTGNGTTATVNFLVADRNGAFDLQLVGNTATYGNSLGFYKPVAQWGFTNIDYSQMMTPIISTTPITPFNRTNIPFAASSIQLIGHDQVTFGSTNYSVGQYLIATSAPQGDVGASDGILQPLKIGGEVFPVRYGSLYTGAIAAPILYTNAYLSTTPTISRPTNSGPLVQPMAALRPQ